MHSAPSAVLAALPAELRSAFVALTAPYGVALEHNDCAASPNHREEQIHDAERALEGRFIVCRFGLRIEVYGRRASSLVAA